MAKIKNTTVYPTVTPAADDLLIATDVSDENKTVTFLVSSITGGAGVNQGLQSVLDTGNTATQTMQLTGNITLLGGAGTGFIDLCQIKLGGSYGVAGQVLTSQGAGSCATWETPAATSCCNLADTLTAGNTATNTMTLTGLGTFTGAGGGVAVTAGGTLTTDATSAATFGNAVNLGTTLNFGATTTLNDYSGSAGTAGQILVVNGAGTGVEWSTGIPSASTPTLQQVLVAGNVATGIGASFVGPSSTTFDANANIVSAGTNTFSGNNTFSSNATSASTAAIALTGTLWDGSSTGTAGQVLTSTGTGVQWSASSAVSVSSVTGAAATTSTGSAQTITPTTGAVVVTPHIYNGGANIGMVPSGGTAGTFLQGDGSWAAGALQDLSSVLTQGNSAANSITLTGSNSITVQTGIFTTLQDSGGSSGVASQVPTANGLGGWAWGTPASGTVSSVSAGAPGTSAGTALTITPTSGAVVVTPNAYAGTTNVGHVPAGGSATTFLRGDGTWVTPASGSITDSVVITQPFNGTGSFATATNYYTFMGADQANFETSLGRINNDLGTGLPGVGVYSGYDHHAGFFFRNPVRGACPTSVDDLTICSVDVEVVATQGGTFRVFLYVGNPCDPDVAFTQIGVCTFTLVLGVISCCSMTLLSTSLANGLGLFLVVAPLADDPHSFSGRINVKMTSS